MAAKQPRVGVDHPTVVPANFDPDDRDSEDEQASRDRSESEH